MGTFFSRTDESWAGWYGPKYRGARAMVLSALIAGVAWNTFYNKVRCVRHRFTAC